MTRFLAPLLVWLCAAQASAFCGFYVARADGDLFNEASKVVYFREGRLSVITMASDYRGAASDFAMIVPTPQVLPKTSVRTVDAKIVTHLDQYSAPRLVEYQDSGPWCNDDIPPPMAMVAESAVPTGILRRNAPTQRQRANALGVTIAAKYAVGTYDVLILKADQSDGLVTFLTSEGYKLPAGAETALNGYISKGMKFFVAKVNLDRHAAGESQDLPPLQIRFRSDDFMLPIQLGKVNSAGPQDVLMMMLSRKGRVEPVSYPVTPLPTDFQVPAFVEEDFAPFYKALFDRAVPASGGIVLEYAWDMGWCDPCAADPLTGRDMRALGVTGLTGKEEMVPEIYVTRLHARYTQTQMQEDITFRETTNRQNFQGRFVIRHPFVGKFDLGEEVSETEKACVAQFISETRTRLQSEAKALSQRTGWPMSRIDARMAQTVPSAYR